MSKGEFTRRAIERILGEDERVEVANLRALLAQRDGELEALREKVATLNERAEFVSIVPGPNGVAATLEIWGPQFVIRGILTNWSQQPRSILSDNQESP